MPTCFELKSSGDSALIMMKVKSFLVLMALVSVSV